MLCHQAVQLDLQPVELSGWARMPWAPICGCPIGHSSTLAFHYLLLGSFSLSSPWLFETHRWTLYSLQLKGRLLLNNRHSLLVLILNACLVGKADTQIALTGICPKLKNHVARSALTGQATGGRNSPAAWAGHSGSAASGWVTGSEHSACVGDPSPFCLRSR